jgi:hypothetical protein
MKIKYYLVIALLSFHCNLNNNLSLNCDENFKKNESHLFIENCFQIIENRLSHTLTVSGDEIYFSFIEKLTNIESSVSFGDVSYYQKKSDYREDIKNWKSWYRNNGCGLKTDVVDSIKLSVGFTPNYTK